MKQQSLIDTQIFKKIGQFIKQQARQFDTWFRLCGLALLATCLAASVTAITFAMITILFIFTGPALCLKIGTTLFIFLILCTFTFCLIILHRLILWAVGFWNAIALNALDAAHDRPFRRFKKRVTGNKYIVLPIIYSLITLIGLIFFIIPGIVFATRFSLARYIMLEQGCTIWQALMESWDITRGYFWTLLLGYFFLLIVHIIPFIFLLELFFPISTLCMAQLYKHLQQQQLTQEIVSV